MNACGHTHYCWEHYAYHGGRLFSYVCYNPECMNLPGVQGLCGKCSFYHGWARAQGSEEDFNVMY